MKISVREADVTVWVDLVVYFSPDDLAEIHTRISAHTRDESLRKHIRRALTPKSVEVLYVRERSTGKDGAKVHITAQLRDPHPDVEQHVASALNPFEIYVDNLLGSVHPTRVGKEKNEAQD